MVGDPTGTGLEQRGGDGASFPGLLAAQERGKDAEGQPGAGADVQDGDAGADRGPVVRAGDLGDAGAGLQNRVVAWPVSFGAGVAVRRQRGVDEPGVPGPQGIGVEAVIDELARAQVGQEDVGIREQVLQDRPAAGLADVDPQDTLVAVHDLPVRRDLPSSGRHSATVVPGAALDVDDVGAEVGQDGAGERGGDVRGEVEDAQAREWQRRGTSCRTVGFGGVAFGPAICVSAFVGVAASWVGVVIRSPGRSRRGLGSCRPRGQARAGTLDDLHDIAAGPQRGPVADPTTADAARGPLLTPLARTAAPWMLSSLRLHHSTSARPPHPADGPGPSRSVASRPQERLRPQLGLVLRTRRTTGRTAAVRTCVAATPRSGTPRAARPRPARVGGASGA